VRDSIIQKMHRRSRIIGQMASFRLQTAAGVAAYLPQRAARKGSICPRTLRHEHHRPIPPVNSTR
jgi:hypothetical protein